jgi:hypothetical protein
MFVQEKDSASKDTKQHEYKQYDEKRTDAASGIVTPASAIGPGWQRTDDQHNEQYQKQKTHDASPR